MAFYKKTGTLLSPLAACWCICCFQLAWWHPFSGSRCCPLLHWYHSGIAPLTSVKWLQIYPQWKQNWTIASLLISYGALRKVHHYHTIRWRWTPVCCATLSSFVSLAWHPRAWLEQKSGWCGACMVTRFPMLNGTVAGPRILNAFPFWLPSVSSCLDMFSKEIELFKLKKHNCKF